MFKNIRRFFGSLMVLSAIFIVSGCGSKTLNLNDYVTYQFEGYDGYGKLTYSIDDDILFEDLVANSDDGTSNVFALIYNLELDGEWSDKDALSNGDKLTFKWDLDKDDIKKIEKKLNINLKYSDITAKVEGLKDISEFDARDYIEVTFSGISPEGYANVKCKIDGLSAKLGEYRELANGDVVTVTLAPEYLDKTMEEICAKNAIPIITKTEYEYTVEGLPAYVSTVEEIPEKAMEIMKTNAEKLIWSEHKDENECATFKRGSWWITYYTHCDFTKLEFERAYVTPSDSYNRGRVYLIYKAIYEDHGIQETYFSVYFSNVKNSVEGLKEDDFEVYSMNLQGGWYALENDDTQCEMLGMTYDDLLKFLEDHELN